MQRHQARIAPVDASIRTAGYWFWGGLAGFGVGLGTGLAVRSESKDISNGFIASGIGLGVIGLVAAYIAAPSPEDQLGAQARRKLFKAGEDDIVAVARGIDHANGQRRLACGGEPAKFEERGAILVVQPGAERTPR